MSSPIKVDSNTFELTVHTSCYCALDLLCYKYRIKSVRKAANSQPFRGCSFKLWSPVRIIEPFRVRPGVNFKKFGRKAQIIETALSIWALRLRPTF